MTLLVRIRISRWPKARSLPRQFYQHDQHWTNRLILGDSLLVMASLAEKERLRGKVQCVYFDPPYGIKFGSNWQVSTRKRDVRLTGPFTVESLSPHRALPQEPTPPGSPP